MLALLTSVHLWLLCKPFIDSAMIVSFLYFLLILFVKKLLKFFVSFFGKLLFLEFLVLVHADNQYLLSVLAGFFCLFHHIHKFLCRMFFQ